MYRCCGLEFDDKEEYLVHFEREHDSVYVLAPRIKCGFVGCCWTFMSADLLKKHVLNHIDVFDHDKYIQKLEKNGGDVLGGNSGELVDKKMLATAHKQSEFVARQLSSLYAEPCMSRQSVGLTVQMSEEIANCPPMIEMRNRLYEIVAKYPIPRQDLRKMAYALHKLSHHYSGFETEEKRMAYYKKSGSLIPFEEYTMGNISAQACDFDIELILRKFMQQPGMLDTVKNFMMKCEDTRSDNFRSILQGALWERKKSLFPGKLVIPLTLYCGDFAVMDSDVKVGAIYVNVPALPRKMQPLLDFVFLSGLHYSADRKHLEPEHYFGPTLEQLKKLQDEGLTLDLGTSQVKVYFCLTHIQAEDYVLDEILGRTSTDECRFCTADEHLRKKMVIDQDDLMRTESTKSVFDTYNLLNSAENWYLDVVTDFLEGVCKLDLVHILIDLIFVQNIISLNNLNRRILTFKYLTEDKRNTPAVFSADDLKNGKIKMDAAQILCFVRNFPMMVGDLIYKHEGDKDEDEQLMSWTLFMRIHSILYVLLAKTSSAPTAEYSYLRELIEDHHTMFMKFAPHNGTLPLAFHNATHYWRIIQQLGPPAVQEARPKVSSEHCFVCRKREEVLGSIAWKHQMIINNKLLMKNYIVDDEDDFKAPKLQIDVKLEVMRDFSVLGPADGLKSVLMLNCFKEIFKIGAVVVQGMDEGGRPVFCRIEHILIDSNQKGVFKLLCAKLKNNYYDVRLGAYSLSECKPKCRLALGRDDFMWRRCFNAHKINGDVYVSLHAEVYV